VVDDSEKIKYNIKMDKKLTDKKMLIKIIVAVVIVAGLGFYGGMRYGQGTVSKTSSNQRSQLAGGFAAMGRNGNRAAGQNGGFAGGQIIAKDATSITVKLQDGSSKIVFVSGSSQIMKSVQGTSSDLTVGENVTVVGTTNSDGSITANSVQVRPAVPQQTQQPQQ
jgi:hypothetical protein